VLQVLCIPIPVNALLYRLQTFFNRDGIPCFSSHSLKVNSLRSHLSTCCCRVPTSTQVATSFRSRARSSLSIAHSGRASCSIPKPLPTMYRSTLRSLRSSTRSLHLPTASARPSPLVNPLSTTSTRFFSTSKAARAIAAPAVGDYHKAESGEPTLNSPSELARKISSKVLPRLEKPDVKKVLVVGSGGLSIGQAGEFDYSGKSSCNVREKLC
jgi:hypothetical protein